MKLNYPLLALAIGAFGIGTTEFSPMGLLPVIAKGVDVSIPAAGMLIVINVLFRKGNKGYIINVQFFRCYFLPFQLITNDC